MVILWVVLCVTLCKVVNLSPHSVLDFLFRIISEQAASVTVEGDVMSHTERNLTSTQSKAETASQKSSVSSQFKTAEYAESMSAGYFDVETETKVSAIADVITTTENSNVSQHLTQSTDNMNQSPSSTRPRAIPPPLPREVQSAPPPLPGHLRPILMEDPRGLDEIHYYPRNAIDNVPTGGLDDSDDEQVELEHRDSWANESYDVDITGLTSGVGNIKPEKDYEDGIRNEKKVYKQQKVEIKKSRRFGLRINKPKVEAPHSLHKLSSQREYMPTFCMMLGIRTMVSMVESKQFVKILKNNFVTSNKLRFPREGTTQTPAHNASSFRFKDYMPEAFRHIRAYFNISPSDYITSVCGNYLFINFISNSKSGQFFFYSYDRRFMIKTITHAESKFLRKIIPMYYDHIMKYPNTLLSRFYGMHRVRFMGQREKHFLVMGSVFYTRRPMDIVYDLKGSVQGRSVTEAEKMSKSCVYKDNDFLERNEKISLGPEIAKELKEQIEIDVEFLRSLDIMDYSLLVGIHDMDLEADVEPGLESHDFGGTRMDHSQAEFAAQRPMSGGMSHVDGPHGDDAVNSDMSIPDGGFVIAGTSAAGPSSTGGSEIGNQSTTSAVKQDHFDTTTGGPRASSASAPASIPDSRGDGLLRSQSAKHLNVNKRRSVHAAAHIPTGYSAGKPLNEQVSNAGAEHFSIVNNPTSGYSGPKLIVPTNINSNQSLRDGPSVAGAVPKTRPGSARTSMKKLDERAPNNPSVALSVTRGEMRASSARTTLPQSPSRPLSVMTSEPKSSPEKVEKSERKEEDDDATTTANEIDGVTITFPQESYTVMQTSENPNTPEEELRGIQSRFMTHDGGILGERNGHRVLYYVGIIDILTIYNWRKRGECWLKSLKYDKNEISAVSPKRYARRFVKYMNDAIE